MDGLHFLLAVVFGVFPCIYGWISRPVLEVSVKPGDNITLYCDCKYSTGVFILWYRNCSHENQPSLSLKAGYEPESTPIFEKAFLNPFPRFHFLANQSFHSYDLQILNFTLSDEGLYFCGTEKTVLVDTDTIIQRHVYAYGNATRVVFNSSAEASQHPTTWEDCDVCRILLFTLCPACAVLSSVLSFLITYFICQKKAPCQDEGNIPNTTARTQVEQDEDVSYAALEIRKQSQRSKRQKSKSSDFSIYSAINTSQM